MAVDSVLDEDEVIEAQWCERQVFQNICIDGEILWYSCDSGSIEALRREKFYVQLM